ncbi:alpha/beta fold hydrolase [Capillimicrobium parvum]|uniref:alpha/beta fold hydrolase n=1 Tax=Capillimicrobium parvum TaxID=2884022 RepID=UPI00216B0B03|nr:alpha/beta hydrolase [Capillimicrobium parvum]
MTPWWSIDWSRHERWLRVHDRWANVVEIGPADGDPVLFIHGLGGSWRNWLEQLPVLAEAGHRAIAVDLPGFGHSEMPADKITIPGYGRWVEALCDELEVSAAAVVGNSMGGFIGTELAIQSPARVERLVLVSAAGISAADQRIDSALQLLYRAEAIGTYMTGLVLARAAALARRPRLRRAAMGLAVRHPEQLSPKLAYEQITGMGTPGFIGALDALSDYPIRHRLPEIACPTLIVWGRQDLIVPVRDADVFEELIPDARKVIWDDTGHVAMLERPERFNELLGDFLAEAPGEEVDETSPAAAPAGD